MTKFEFVDAVYSKVKKSNATLNKRMTERIIDGMFTYIAKSIRRQKRVVCSRFGTFVVRKRRWRRARNIRTKEPMKIPTVRSVYFKPSKFLKNSL
jgi:DNA-binding protein HU-alpha